MSAGSGVDVTSLAQSLVNAEKLPKETELNTKITKNEARVSGYSAVMFMMTELKKAFTALKDRNNFNALSASNSNPSAFSVTASESAVTGSHEIEVTRLAKAQRSVSAGFASATTPLNGGAAMSLSLKIGSASAVARAVSTRQGVSAATESATVTFQDLAPNETVTVGGLTYTASQATTAADVAAAFADPASSPSNFSGSLRGFTCSLIGYVECPSLHQHNRWRRCARPGRQHHRSHRTHRHYQPRRGSGDRTHERHFQRHAAG